MESSMSKRPALDPLMLAQFTGSQNFYRHGLVREVLYTEGAEYVADTAGAYWLLDEIALAQRYIIPVKREDFQVWDLKVNADQSAMLTCGDGNGREVYSKPVPFTDFPEPGIRFYYADWVIHLPSEY
jgi:hypothetical protein